MVDRDIVWITLPNGQKVWYHKDEYIKLQEYNKSYTKLQDCILYPLTPNECFKYEEDSPES